MAQMKSDRYDVVDMAGIAPADCHCGQSRRAFVDDPDRVATLHMVDIRADSVAHYHRKLTELYYVLEGEGHMELDGQMIPVKPGTAVMIKPLCRHRAVGQMRVLVIPIPGHDPSDEHFDA